MDSEMYLTKDTLKEMCTEFYLLVVVSVLVVREIGMARGSEILIARL
jgi:hypothetical protein